MVSSVDRLDITHSKLRYILFAALKQLHESELFECVRDEDIILRTLAAREVHSRGTDKCFAFALGLIDSNRFEDREIGAFILGQLGAPQYRFLLSSLPPLEKLLSDDYHEVRSTAVQALGFLAAGTGSTLSPIQDKVLALEFDPSDCVREALSLTLGSIHTPESRLVLDRLLLDESVDVRNAAAYGIEMHEEHTS